MVAMPHIHNASAAVPQPHKEIRDMATAAISPFRPKHSKWLRRDTHNVLVVIGKHQEIPLQQTLKAHV
ncbi:hypothetical protein G205_23117 [Arthrobacter nitrophenolicus]|uniref:Uncharacterized protein n=1 Tax=Arthrobacter nitrophenolicus TaxID=683150 RepID=L8TLX8_9MICC|nr:hypothetical protein G205_23117 [Arthrobacter nitrophenolicus]